MNKKRLFWDYKELHHLHELLHQHSTPTSAPTFLSPPPCCAFNQFTSLVFRTHQGSQQTVLRMSSFTSHPTTQVIRIDLRRTYLMPAGKVHVLIIIVIIIIIIIDDTSHPMLLALQMADMHMGRGSLCTAMQGFMLWAVGGRDSHTFHNSTECFHAGQNRWTWGPSTNTKRFAAASASLHNAIYITGGFDATMYTATAERMDPREGKWSPVGHHLLWCCIMPVSIVTDIMTSIAGDWQVGPQSIVD